MYDDSKSVYAAPALESTLLIEKGGMEDTNQIGIMPSTNLSAAVSSGTRIFQYNRYFWNKEWFTFNYTNNAIGIAVSYYRQITSSYCFCIYPILLPRIAMTLLQSITSSPTDDFEDRSTLLKELVYYLNIGFTTYGVGNNYGYQPYGDAFRMAPWVTAYEAKGSPYSPLDVGRIDDNPDFPLFNDGVTPPILQWVYPGNNGQISLQINQNHPRILSGDRVGFQIITLERYMADSPYVSDPTYFGGFHPSATYYGGLNNYPAASYGDGKGWCCEGAFATGFGQSSSYSSFENQQESPTTYTDIYTPAERLQLWQNTKFPMFSPNITTLPAFMQLCTDMKLISNVGNGTGILTSRFITSLIPYRFFSIESEALTRNQKRPVSSNNPNLTSPGTMAIQFITLDALRTWDDHTVAGQSSSAGSILYGSRKSGIDDCSIVSLDPMQSLQTLDLVLRDEWGNILQNYSQLQSFGTAAEADVMMPMEQFGIIPASFTPAVWAQAYNPLPSANHESIFINESWWSSAYQFYGFNPESFQSTNTNEGFAPSAPRSTTLTHFGRVLGY